MKTLLFLLFISLGGVKSAYTQIDSASLRKYYQNIYKAEGYILANRLDSSLIAYSAAFKTFSKFYAVHAYNAAIVADKLNKLNIEYSLLKKLCNLGIDYRELDSCKAFPNFFHISNEKRLIKLKKEKCFYDKNYRAVLNQLFYRDQFFRLKDNNYKLYTDTIRKIDKQNIDDLLKIIEDKGFPSEERVGVLNLNEIKNPKYSVIIIHQSMGSMQQYDFTSFLKNSIQNGSIEKKMGFYLYGRTSGTLDPESLVRAIYIRRKDPNNSAMLPQNTEVIDSTAYGHFPFKENFVSTKNKIRKEFFLDDFESNIAKMLFNRQNPEYILATSGAFSNFVYEDRGSFDRVKSQLIYYK